MAHTGRSAVSGVVDYQSMATRNRLDVGPLALTPPKKPSPGLEGRYRSLARIDTSAAPAPAARSGGLELYLESRGLGAYAPRIRALGARKVADLQLLSDEDIDDLGVPKELRVVLKVDVATDEMASFSIEGSGPGGDRREIIFYRHNDDDPK